jgi:hypothetical protein
MLLREDHQLESPLWLANRILVRQLLYLGETKEGQRLPRPGPRVVDNDIGRTVMTFRPQ